MKTLTWLLFAGAFAPALPAQQPGELSYHDESIMPEGIVGERIESMIETFNSGDPERVQQFLQDEATSAFRSFAPMEEHQQVFASTYRQWGPVSFHSIRTYNPARPDEVIVILRDSNFGSWRAFTFEFDENADHRVSSFAFNSARTPSNVDEPPLPQADAIEEVATVLNRICDRDLFSGTVLIARDEDVLFTHACGEASKRFHVPNRLDTKFNLGSMNKMFTSVAIMQLVERGVLSLDDPISKYVDESWLPRTTTERITVHHLLTHTSGLGSYFNDTYWQSSRENFRELDDYKPLVKTEMLAFEPGAEFRYSNTGMFLLGVVLESATGEDYFDYIREHIYAPAGMVGSDSYDMDMRLRLREQPVQARDPRRAGRRRILDGRGPVPVRQGAHEREAPLEGLARADVGGPRGRRLRLWLLRSGWRAGTYGRSRRWVSGTQLESRHHAGPRLRRGGDVELRVGGDTRGDADQRAVGARTRDELTPPHGRRTRSGAWRGRVVTRVTGA
jgi:CubicO group peptidase (beta-lactamase class C family)